MAHVTCHSTDSRITIHGQQSQSLSCQCAAHQSFTDSERGTTIVGPASDSSSVVPLQPSCSSAQRARCFRAAQGPFLTKTLTSSAPIDPACALNHRSPPVVACRACSKAPMSFGSLHLLASWLPCKSRPPSAFTAAQPPPSRSCTSHCCL